MTDPDTDLDPGPLARAAAALGEPDAVYAVSPARVRAKFALAGGLFLYGIIANYLWWFVGPARPDHLVLLVLFGPPIWGISILRHIRRARGLHILAYPTGLLRMQDDQAESYPWAELTEIRLRADRGEVKVERGEGGEPTACWIAVEPPLMKFWDAGLTAVRRDGTEATFTPAVAEYPDLARRVQVGTFAALWPDVWDRFASGEVLAFGGYTADLTGLHAGKQSVGWADVAAAEIAGKKLTVKRSGKWLAWAAVELAGIPNPHVLLALIEEAKRAHGKPEVEEAEGTEE